LRPFLPEVGANTNDLSINAPLTQTAIVT